MRIPLSEHQLVLLEQMDAQERQIRANRSLFITAIVAGVMKPDPSVPLRIEGTELVVVEEETDGG